MSKPRYKVNKPSQGWVVYRSRVDPPPEEQAMDVATLQALHRQFAEAMKLGVGGISADAIQWGDGGDNRVWIPSDFMRDTMQVPVGGQIMELLNDIKAAEAKAAQLRKEADGLRAENAALRVALGEADAQLVELHGALDQSPE